MLVWLLDVSRYGVVTSLGTKAGVSVGGVVTSMASAIAKSQWPAEGCKDDRASVLVFQVFHSELVCVLYGSGTM